MFAVLTVRDEGAKCVEEGANCEAARSHTHTRAGAGAGARSTRTNVLSTVIFRSVYYITEGVHYCLRTVIFTKGVLKQKTDRGGRQAPITKRRRTKKTRKLLFVAHVYNGRGYRRTVRDQVLHK